MDNDFKGNFNIIKSVLTSIFNLKDKSLLKNFPQQGLTGFSSNLLYIKNN